MAKVNSKRNVVRALLGASVLLASTFLTGGAVQAAGPSQISGVAWNDTNADGLRSADEPVFAGATVTLRDSADGSVVAGPVSTASDGSYLFGALSAGSYYLSAEAPANRLVSGVSVDNAFTPDGGGSPASTATTASIPVAAIDTEDVRNLAIRPRPELSLGQFGPGVLDGASPFNVGGTCQNPVANPTPTGSDEWSDTSAPGQVAGDDCGSQNGVVRSQESIATIWSVTADNYEPGAPDLQDVIFEQIIHTAGGAKADFERIPVSCVAPPSGSGGTNPLSSITYDSPNPGDVKLVCNLGSFPEGFQESLTTFVKVDGASPNGSSVSTEQRVYSVDSAGSADAVPFEAPTIGPITVSARPAYDVAKNAIPITSGGVGNYDMSFDDDLPSCDDNPQPCDIGPERGSFGYFLVSLSSDSQSGNEALAQPISLDDQFYATTAGGAPYSFEFEITACDKNTSGWPNAVYGRALNTTGGWHDAYVQDSGNCVPTRADSADPTSDYDLVLSNVDMSGNEYPTRTYGGSDLSAGPYYVSMHRVRFFIPNRTLDMADGVADDQGTISVGNCIQNFDPDGASGVSNYGAGTEPGYNQTAMPDGSGTNNCAAPRNFSVSVLVLTTRGSLYKYNYSHVRNPGYLSQASGDGTHSGQISYEASRTFVGTVMNYNSGDTELEGAVACDVFDNSTLQLSTADSVGQSGWIPSHLAAGDYAYVNGVYNGTDNPPSEFIVEYASANLSVDDPLSGGFDALSGRYEGDWSVAREFRCDDNAVAVVDGTSYGLSAPTGAADPDGDGWTTDPTAFANGIDDVNMVRARFIDPTDTLKSRKRLLLMVPLRLRSTFNSGPHAGESIPLGTVMPNFASGKWDNYRSGAWTARSYNPSPLYNAGDGDRVTLTAAHLRLVQHTLTPPAGVGQTGSTLAGSQIVWALIPTLTSALTEPIPVENVQIVDVLPADATYNAACTAALANGRVPSSVEYDTPNPGETRLTWNLGALVPNQPVTPIEVCTDSNPLAINGTTVTADASISATGVVNNPTRQQDEHTVILEQNGSVQLFKTVDVTLDAQNDSQVFTLEWQNYAQAFPIIQPTVIDVFAYNGDGVGSLSERVPASQFSGDYVLDGEPTTVFSDGSVPGVSDPFTAIGVWSYSADAPGTIEINPDANTSTWCVEADFGQAGCPATFDEVTAIKFVSNYPLDRDGNPRQGVRATYTMQAGDDSPTPDTARQNEPGDRYTNRFALDTPSLVPAQFIRSNSVTVDVAAHSLGDLIFSDADGNGRFDVASDALAPDGVVVQVFDAADDQRVGQMVTGSAAGSLGAGRYLFPLLPAGDYYVVLPASNFAAGGALQGWSATLIGAGVEPDDDDNEAVDQHGYSPGIVTANGIRTGVITLSATAPLPGELPLGHEPTGDNTGGITDFTSDSFSNLTLDIGLVGPAQLSIEKEVCNQTPLADCDESDASHWDEVSEVAVFDDARWRVTVTNSGTQVLSQVAISDALVASCDRDHGSTPALVTMLVGSSYRYTCDSTELTVGFINTARVDATGALGQALSDSDTAAVTLATSEPEIVVEKATNTQDADAAPGVYVPVGDAVEWTYVVTNPGNMPLTNVRLVDDNGTPTDAVDDRTMSLSSPEFLSGDADGDMRLDVGETWRFSVTGIAVAGQYTNVAEVFGAPVVPGLSQVTDTDPSNYFGIDDVGILVEKATNAASALSPTTAEDADTGQGPFVVVGDTVTWTYLVTTVGQSVPLSMVGLVDDAGTPALAGDDFVPVYVSGDSNTNDLLDANETWLLRAEGLASEVAYENHVVASGRGPETTAANGSITAGAVLNDNDLSHYVGAASALSVIKEVNGADANTTPGPSLAVGSTAGFTYEVTNDGNITLMGIGVVDDQGVAVSCPQTVLAPDEAMTCTGSQEVVAGQYTNIGTASGTPAVAGPNAAMPWVVLELADGTSAPGPTASDPANYFGVESGITINKQVNGTESASLPGVAIVPGDTALFTYEVTNTGDAVLMDVLVTDDQGVAVSCPETVLAPDESMTCTGSQGAVAGQYTNIGSVIGTPAVPGPDAATPWQPLVNGDGTSPDKPVGQDTAHYFGLLPRVDITKYVNGHDANDAPGVTLPTGADVVWTYVVTNTGNTFLTDVSVTDDQGVEVTCPETALAVNASMTCVGSGQVVAGPYLNIGVVSGSAAVGDGQGGLHQLEWADGTLVDAVTDSDPANNFGFSNGITIRKDVFGFDAPAEDRVFTKAGTIAPFTYLVTNTGNTWIDQLVVEDDQGVDVRCPTTLLAPGASMTCEGTGEIPIGDYTNIGTVVGVPSIDTVMGLVPVTNPDTGTNVTPVSAADDANVFGEHARIDLTKVACYEGDCEEGLSVPVNATLTWHIEVTNTGNVALSNVQIVDDKVSACDQVIESLAVGETVVIECQAKVSVTRSNTAEATATPVTQSTDGSTGSEGSVGSVAQHSQDTATVKVKTQTNLVLAYTGASTLTQVGFGLGMLAGGLLLLLLGRRREQEAGNEMAV